jgi:hypothetical protein
MEKTKSKPIPEFLYDRVAESARVVPLNEIMRAEGYENGVSTNSWTRRTTLRGEVLTPVIREFIEENGMLIPNPKLTQPVSETIPDSYIGVILNKRPNPAFVRKPDNND